MQKLTVPAAVEALETVTAFVDAFLEARGCSMKTQMQIDLSVEEIFVNIAHYAYGDSPGDAELRISEKDGTVSISFLDAGTPYNPLEREDPDLTLAAEQRPIGGLGIFLVKKNMDTVSYRRQKGKNVLTVTKKL